jgi:hypothetical protein
MNFSAGLFVIALVGLLAVVMPCVFLAIRFWRAGTRSRIGVCLGMLFVLVIGIVCFGSEPIAGAGSFEENLVIFLGTWGILFYSFAALSSVVVRVRRML